MEYATLLTVVIAALLGYRYLWRRARVEHGPVSCRVDELSTGWVELRGRVRGTGTVRSPVSGRDVVGYAVNVQQERGATAWESVVDVCRVMDFELEDESGRVLVRASASEVQLETKVRKGKGGPFRGIPVRIARLLHRYGRPVAGVLFARAFRWREHLLEDGQMVRLRGYVSEMEADEFGSVQSGGHYRVLPRRLAVVGAASHPVQLVSDD